MEEDVQIKFDVFVFIEILNMVYPMILALRILLDNAIFDVEFDVIFVVNANCNLRQLA